MKGEHYFRELDRAHEKKIESTLRKLDRLAKAIPGCIGNDTRHHRWNIHGVCSDCEATRWGAKP